MWGGKLGHLLLLVLISVFSLNASQVAIVDSGTDTRHEFLKSYVWINPVDNIEDGVDRDNNGYVNDIYGWNFAEKSNQVIDYSYLGTFSEDVYRYFDIQSRFFIGQITDEEMHWMKSKKEDPNFIDELSTFGSFAHGTHVSGISVRDSANNKIMAVKIIPTRTNAVQEKVIKMVNAVNSSDPANLNNQKGFEDFLFLYALQQLAQIQAKQLEEVGAYLNFHRMNVANGSFGTGYGQAEMVVTMLYKTLFKKDPTPEQVKQFALHFLNSVVKESKKFVDNAPNTLFVFAAGNDGSDNDQIPSSPTNVKSDNTLSVAATIERSMMAPFSNYGIEMVEVAAPGVGIYSSIPDDGKHKYMKMSGTSQAAPYVTNVAGEIFEINPSLSPKEVKKIIMATVDVKSFLQGKVKTGGIVNPDRALKAAELTRSGNLDDAIALAKEMIEDVPTKKHIGLPSTGDFGWIMPLPSPFVQ